MSQSKYPIQKIIDGDTFVVLTKKQADDINQIFESQKRKIGNYKKEIANLDSLLRFAKIDTVYNPELGKRLDLLENWLYFSAIDGAWIYYSYVDSSVYSVDLSYYSVRKDDQTGDLLFIRNEVPYDPEKKEFPMLNWNKDIIEPKQPRISIVPLKTK